MIILGILALCAILVVVGALVRGGFRFVDFFVFPSGRQHKEVCPRGSSCCSWRPASASWCSSSTASGTADMAKSHHGSKPQDWTKLMLFVRKLQHPRWNPFCKRTRRLLKWMSNEKAKCTWNRKRRAR